MEPNRNKSKHPVRPLPGKRPVARRHEKTLLQSENRDKLLKLLLPATVSVITLICFSFSIKSGFVHWDDNDYVYDNPFIRNFSAQNLKTLLFNVTTSGNYHPLTMLSLALNYHFSGLSPAGYHITNIFLHIINTLLVYFLFVKIFEAMQKCGYGIIPAIPWLAALGALWHGIHPMHVESVSWISERKDLLYACFYFSGLLVYIKYIQTNQWKLFLLVLFLFILSSLSKSMAVVFPLTLFTLDFLLKRQFSTKVMLEKVPFFLISLLLGIYAFILQNNGGAMPASLTFSLFQRIQFSFYAFVMYLVRTVAPIHLSAVYPYPLPDANNMLPLLYLISPLLALLIVGIPVFFAYKAGAQYFRLVTAGLLFYFFNVLLILKFITVGFSILNDRYTYIAYFGFFLIILYIGIRIYEKYPAARLFIKVIAVGYSIILGFLCYNRTMVWYNTASIWEDVKQKYPLRVEDAYELTGDYYRELAGSNPVYFDSVLANYEVLKNVMHTKHTMVYSNMAIIYAIKKEYDKSLDAYSIALALNKTDTNTYFNRATTYINMNKPDLAIADLTTVISLDSNLTDAIQIRSNEYYLMGNYPNAIKDYTHLIRLNPLVAEYYLRRGGAEFKIGDLDKAQADFEQTLKLQPNNTECMYNISILFHTLKSDKQALKYALNAKQLGYPLPTGYLESLTQ